MGTLGKDCFANSMVNWSPRTFLVSRAEIFCSQITHLMFVFTALEYEMIFPSQLSVFESLSKALENIPTPTFIDLKSFVTEIEVLFRNS